MLPYYHIHILNRLNIITLPHRGITKPAHHHATTPSRHHVTTEDLVVIFTLAFGIETKHFLFLNIKTQPIFNMTLFEGGPRCYPKIPPLLPLPSFLEVTKQK